MKKVILILVLLSTSINCFAQNQPADIINKDGSRATNAYYKDTHNYLNQFVGTWLYTNTSTNTSLEMRLFKRLMNYSFNNTFEDILYGEYRYVENGIEKINTLTNLNINHVDAINYGINGNFILDKNSSPICNECSSNQKRVLITLKDNTKHSIHDIRARVDIVGGQTIMKALIYSNGMTWHGVPGTGNVIRDLVRPGVDVGVTIPIAYYDFIKQP